MNGCFRNSSHRDAVKLSNLLKSALLAMQFH